jgi:two-component system cell cycle sensor histidine kinase/response regulator CckA
MTASNRRTLLLPLFAWVWVAALAIAASQGAAPIHRQAPIALVATSSLVAASALAAVFGVARQRETVVCVPPSVPAEPSSAAEPEGVRSEAELRQLHTMAAVGRLAGGVAHDFGNLLNVILGYGQLAQRKLPADHPCRRHLDEILRAADRGAGLTKQLLGVSRDREPSVQVFDLAGLVQDDERMLRRLIGDDVRLEVTPPSGAARVKADRAQLGQVLMNLAANARDAMPQGGTLTLETRTVDLSAADASARGVPPGRYAVVRVSDTGCGMDADTLDRVFEPFFTTKAEGKGTGLGLATVDAAVRRNGGFVAVESVRGEGTTFAVHLPCVGTTATVAPVTLARERMQVGTEGVLLVEDDAALRGLLGEVLTTAGYRVFDAATPEEALVIAEHERRSIDLLLTDVVMPGMSGPDLARRLSARQHGLSVLYMSGHAQEALGGRGIVEAGSRILQKPFMAEYLLSKIRDVLAADAVA